jgi:threonine synthase
MHVCEECLGPLDVAYDQAAARRLTRAVIEARPRSMWRYAELLPLDGPPAVGLETGMTPLVRADRLAARIGLGKGELWIKNDGVSHPTLSFKDRVVAVAISKARELGLPIVACASTGNLANATAALAAAAGMPCVVLVPRGIEPAKVLATSVYGARVIEVDGTYDEVDRLSSEIADAHGWGFVNINLRPFYGEGSKTVGHEIAEQLGWRVPAHVVVPVAGGSLLVKIGRGFAELAELGLVERRAPRMHAAQAAGCAPVASMIIEGRDTMIPIKDPQTIARSIAVGDPGDGYYARAAILGSGGFAAAPDDAESLECVRLLAETEGVFAEIAGGVTVAAARRLIAQGHIGRDDGPVILVITGQGLKTTAPLEAVLPVPARIAPRLSEFERLLQQMKETERWPR